MLTLTAGTSGVLMFVGYSFSRSFIEKRATENISQQIEIIRDKFDAEYRTNLNRSLRSLVNDPTLDDYLRASVDERLLLRGKIESKFRQVLRDFSSYNHIVFVDADGNAAISIMKGSNVAYPAKLESKLHPTTTASARSLFSRIEATPLLLSSGNMEWFMPRREVQVVGPFVSENNLIQAVAGIAKLDLDTGGFGGVIMIHQLFDDFFADLREVKFFGENPLWIFSPEGKTLQGPEAGGAPLDLAAALPGKLQNETLMQTSGRGIVAFRDFSIVPGEPFFRLKIEIPQPLLLKDLQPAVRFFTIVLAISVVVLLFLSLYISRLLSRPFMELQTTEGRLANAQRIARLGHWEYDPMTETLVLSEQARNILGMDEACAAIELPTFFKCIDLNERSTFEKKINKAIRVNEGFSLETGIKRWDGLKRDTHHEIVVEYDFSGRNKRVLGTIQDITERKETEQKIRHLAYYDEVTGLPNRTLLNELGAHVLAPNTREDRYAAILFLDLDHFKKVNDTVGHSAGDELLRQVSDRLRHCVRQGVDASFGHVDVHELESSLLDSNVIARLGGDEFIVLLSGLREFADAGDVARRINDAIAKRFVINDKDIYTTCSIGISVCPRDGETTEELLQHADAAMYKAKTSGRNRHIFYSPEIYEQVQSRLNLETELHNATAKNQFQLVYQPRVDIKSGSTVSIEALIRWAHPEHGLITPDRFISAAEETGLIIPIGEFVLATACRQIKSLHEAGFHDIGISVNISAAQFNKGLVGVIDEILTETRLDAHYLELELTESLLIENIDVGAGLFSELKAMGLNISIDDFGKGYSSLSLLKHLPVDTLKIDKSFTLDILNDPGDALIVKSTIELGHNLQLKVVAEGVEHAGQLEFLSRHGCDEAQGFLFSKPIPSTEVAHWLDKNTSTEPVRINA
jgi:diguanylate cyclase (GGDEF)-like protein